MHDLKIEMIWDKVRETEAGDRIDSYLFNLIKIIIDNYRQLRVIVIKRKG